MKEDNMKKAKGLDGGSGRSSKRQKKGLWSEEEILDLIGKTLHNTSMESHAVTQLLLEKGIIGREELGQALDELDIYLKMPLKKMPADIIKRWDPSSYIDDN
jgi:hypothetical protein